MRYTIEQEIASVEDAHTRHVLDRLNRRVTALSVRIAKENRIAARSYLLSREQERIEELQA